MIPYGQHQLDDDDIDAVVNVLRNQFLTQGQQVPIFEQHLCTYTGSQYAVAVNSGTSGLHIACLAAGLAAGDWLWTTPNSFVASANCARYCGAQVDFVDIDPHSRNMSLSALATKLEQASRTKRLPKVIVVVHFAGLSCDMCAVRELADKYGVILIEDAAHALGGSYNQGKVGSCQFSDMTVLSFHPVKSITTAEGGAVLCNDPALHHKLLLLAKHGITRDPLYMTQASHGPWYYQQIELGYNYRLSDVHAALGNSQLAKLDQFIAKRRQVAQRYFQALQHLPLTLPPAHNHEQSAWHLYMVELQQHARKDIFAQLQARGIGVNVHYIPIHLQPYYQQQGFKPGDFPNAEAFYQNALTLPLFPGLRADDQDTVINALLEVLV